MCIFYSHKSNMKERQGVTYEEKYIYSNDLRNCRRNFICDWYVTFWTQISNKTQTKC